MERSLNSRFCPEIEVSKHPPSIFVSDSVIAFLETDGRTATHVCDVREDLRIGQEPFSKVMTVVATLAPDDVLELIAPFQPAPL